VLKLAVVSVVALAVLAAGVRSITPAPAKTFRVLAFTKTAGFRHDSIPAAMRALRRLGAQNGFSVVGTEDARAFSEANLERYRVVVFLLTTGNVLDDRQQAAFERYLRKGRGFVGVHSAADTEYDWQWYGGLIGTYFKSHPAIQRAVVTVRDRAHPSTASLPRRWMRRDEWYNFRTNPSGSVRVLAALDETSYAPGDGAMGTDHPIAWWHEYDGGRSWYTAGGHTAEAYSEPLFLKHLLGGIFYAAGSGRPEMLAVTARTRARRLVVTISYLDCMPCRATLGVQVRGRQLTTAAAGDGTAARLTSTKLPPGRWQWSVVLADRTTGMSTTIRRSVRIR
jgi:cytochrome c